MTEKQIQILKLFALGYPLHTIAIKQQISISTVRSKLKAIHATNEFNNACSTRHCYKRAKANIRNPKQLNELSIVLYKY
jgi:DNA-binding NarL/FixJ family response regulator